MAQSEPSWWYAGGATWQRNLLRPVASLYGRIAAARYSATTPERAARPVICVGNFTAGGTGKTPMSLLIADLVEQNGGAPWFLSRGYGGRLDGQERVDPARHTAAEVGDEPLLLAARAPTVTSRDRRLGAEFIARQAPANAVIIMDDGLQNPALAKDLTIAVVDAARGLGNGAVIPAGPLRAPHAFQLARTDLMVFNGTSGTRARDQRANPAAAKHIPILSPAPEVREPDERVRSRAELPGPRSEQPAAAELESSMPVTTELRSARSVRAAQRPWNSSVTVNAILPVTDVPEETASSGPGGRGPGPWCSPAAGPRSAPGWRCRG